jgi:hypothetical protein
MTNRTIGVKFSRQKGKSTMIGSKNKNIDWPSVETEGQEKKPASAWFRLFPVAVEKEGY